MGLFSIRTVLNLSNKRVVKKVAAGGWAKQKAAVMQTHVKVIGYTGGAEDNGAVDEGNSDRKIMLSMSIILQNA